MESYLGGTNTLASPSDFVVFVVVFVVIALAVGMSLSDFVVFVVFVVIALALALGMGLGLVGSGGSPFVLSFFVLLLAGEPFGRELGIRGMNE